MQNLVAIRPGVPELLKFTEVPSLNFCKGHYFLRLIALFLCI